MPRSSPCVCCFSSPPSSWRLGFVVVGVRGVYGAVEHRHASVDSAWFLTQNSGFGLTASGRTDGGRTDGRNRAPPQTPLALRTGSRTGTRISISGYLRFLLLKIWVLLAPILPTKMPRSNRHKNRQFRISPVRSKFEKKKVSSLEKEPLVVR